MTLEVQIIHTKPIFGGVEVVSVCPIENNPRNNGIRTMGKNKDIIIIEVSFCKCTKTLIVKFMEFVPSMNIAGDVGYRQILGIVYEEQIEALVICRRDIYTRMTCSNPQLKIPEKTRTRKKVLHVVLQISLMSPSPAEGDTKFLYTLKLVPPEGL